MVEDLFSHHGNQLRRRQAPLADRLRPTSLEEFEGQNAILAEGRLLRRAITADRVGNLILHGPPGVGKTTLARIIATHTRAQFSSLNAVLAGVKDLREQVDAAKERLEKIQRINTLAYVNAGVLAFVALGVAYELLHVDVEAIVALYTYCLPVENEDAYRLATSLYPLAR